MTTLTERSVRVYALARRQGWWDKPTDEEQRVRMELALVAIEHMNLTAFLEAARKGETVNRAGLLDPELVVSKLSPTQITDLAKMALIHSEVTEAVDCIIECDIEQTGGVPQPDDFVSELTPITKPEGAVVELADVIIRALDWCGHKKLDIEKAVIDKHRYNGQRAHRHGGKLA